MAEPGLAQIIAGVRLVVFDVDGVLTDGRLYFGARGEALKVFHVRDGYGLQALRSAGLMVGLLTGRRSVAVTRRARELGIPLVAQSARDKGEVLRGWCVELALDPGAVAYLGDDTPDLPAMRIAGLPVAVADAHPSVLACARLVTRLPGGQGAARELCDLLLDPAHTHAG